MPGETELPQGRRQGGLQTAGLPQGSSTRPCRLVGARDEACGWQTQTRHLAGHVRRQGPRDAQELREETCAGRRVASEVSVRAPAGAGGLGKVQLHPQAPREGLKAAGRGASNSRWGTPWATSTPRLPAHLSPGQAHRQLTCQLKPRVDNSLLPTRAPRGAGFTRSLCAQGALCTRGPGGVWRETPAKAGAAAPPRGPGAPGPEAEPRPHRRDQDSGGLPAGA